jgi:hypothetical protein
MSNSARLVAFEHALPGDRRATYLVPTRYAFWVKNTSGAPVHIRTACVRLEPETGVNTGSPMLVAHRDLDTYLAPGERRSVEVIVTPPLIALSVSNSFAVGVELEPVGSRGLGSSRWEWREQFDWTCVYDAPSHEDGEVFISFVEENDSLAECAARYLRRAGMRPYIAKHDSRVGCDYWEEKIYPAIDRSAGVLVIWTAETAARPASVLREIERARNSGRSFGLYLASGVAAPKQYPRKIKEYGSFDPGAPYADLAEAIAAGADHWAKTGEFFD